MKKIKIKLARYIMLNLNKGAVHSLSEPDGLNIDIAKLNPFGSLAIRILSSCI